MACDPVVVGTTHPFGNIQTMTWPPRFILLLLLSASTTVPADDWPQWFGPSRDGIWREKGLLETFPAEGPRIRWRTPIGSGYSGPAVAAGRVFTMDRFSPGDGPDVERVLCLDEANGKILWVQEYPCRFNLSYPAGPRATPAIDGGRVYTLGTMGILACWDVQTGQRTWAHDLPAEFRGKVPTWGFAGQPLVDGTKLICLAGGEDACVVAFNKDTGAEIWRVLNAPEPGYSAPVIVEAGGCRQLIVWHPRALNSLDPETGKVYWSQPYTANAGMTIATPRKLHDLLLVSSFYNGSMLMRLSPGEPKAQLIWKGRSDNEVKTDGLHCVMGTPVMEDGYIYGVCSYGQLRCLKLDTAERLWETFTPVRGKATRWGTSFIVKNGNRYFLWNELGDLIIAKLSPSGYEEISRAHLMEPTNRDAGRMVVWSHPAFANKSMYARNDQELIRVDLAAP
jgi:outer membrane protein assembly factor BamB